MRIYMDLHACVFSDIMIICVFSDIMIMSMRVLRHHDYAHIPHDHFHVQSCILLNVFDIEAMHPTTTAVYDIFYRIQEGIIPVQNHQTKILKMFVLAVT